MRPFDKDRAMRGEPICRHNGDYVEFIAGPDKVGFVCTQRDQLLSFDGVLNLRMAPIAQVEGKDVYPGDVLYNDAGIEFAIQSNGRAIIGKQHPLDYAVEWNELTWTPPPKTERAFLVRNPGWSHRVSFVQSVSGIQGTILSGDTQITRIRINGEWHDISEGFEVEVGS